MKKVKFNFEGLGLPDWRDTMMSFLASVFRWTQFDSSVYKTVFSCSLEIANTEISHQRNVKELGRFLETKVRDLRAEVNSHIKKTLEEISRAKKLMKKQGYK